MALGEKKSFFGRLAQKVNDLFTSQPTVDDDLLDELEDILITSDLGVDTTIRIVDQLRQDVRRNYIYKADKVMLRIKEIISEMVDKGEINGKVAKEVFTHVYEDNIEPKKYVEEKGLKMDDNEDDLRKTVEEIVSANPKSVEDFKSGKKQAMGFLVGQVMRASGGKANPQMVNQILSEILSNM